MTKVHPPSSQPKSELKKELDAIAHKEIVAYIRDEMKSNKVGHIELSERLSLMGRPISAQGLRNKISTGVHSTTWFFDLLDAIKTPVLECKTEAQLDELANQRIKKLLRDEMLKHNVSYPELVDRLIALGREISEQVLKNAISKGTHRTTWFWDVMKSIHQGPAIPFLFGEMQQDVQGEDVIAQVQEELMQHIRLEMNQHNVDYTELADRLTALGHPITPQGLRNKVSKGSHKTVWYWVLMKAIRQTAEGSSK